VSELLLLYALGLVHGGFAGFREATGRNLLIGKSRYYVRAIARGVIAAQAASMIIFLVLLAMFAASGDGPRLLEVLGGAGRAALTVYLGYTALVLAAYVPYLVPSLESRALTIVAVFGPLTLMLPVVMLAGAAAALIAVPRAEVAILFATSIAAVSLVEPTLAAGGWSLADAERLGGR
jgi:hypothetical protein